MRLSSTSETIRSTMLFMSARASIESAIIALKLQSGCCRIGNILGHQQLAYSRYFAQVLTKLFQHLAKRRSQQKTRVSSAILSRRPFYEQEAGFPVRCGQHAAR